MKCVTTAVLKLFKLFLKETFSFKKNPDSKQGKRYIQTFIQVSIDYQNIRNTIFKIKNKSSNNGMYKFFAERARNHIS